MRTTILFLMLLIMATRALSEKQISLRYDAEWDEEVTFWGNIACRAGRRRTFSLHKIPKTDPSRRLHDFFDDLVTRVQTNCGATTRTTSYGRVEYTYNHGNSSVFENVEPTVIRDKSPIIIENFEKPGWSSATDTHLFPQRDVEVLLVLMDDSVRVLMNGGVFTKWDNTRHVIVLMLTETRVTPSVSQLLADTFVTLLRRLWHEHRVLNVFFAAPFSSMGHLVWFYDPYVEGATAGTRGRIFARKVSRLPEINRFMNLQGYKLNIGMFEAHPAAIKYCPASSYELPFAESSQGFVGIDGLTMASIAKHMNFTFDIVPPTDGVEFGYVHPNGTFFGTIGDAAYHKIDIGFNSMYSKIYSQQENYVKTIEFTTPIDSDRLCVIVPRAQKIPRWLRTFYYFHPAIWVCLVITHVIVALVWYLVRVLRVLPPGQVNTESTDYRSLLLATFYLFIGAPINIKPRQIEKIILAALLLFGITVTGTFTGTLYHSFTTEMYYREIGSLRELDDLGIPIGTASPNLRDVFGLREMADDPTEIKSLQNKLKVVDTENGDVSTIEKTAYRRDIASLSRENSFAVSQHLYVDEIGESLLHLVPECPRAYYLSYVVPKNSLYLKRLNVLISRLLQAGLPPLWNSLTTDRLIHVQTAVGQRSLSNGNRVPFNLRDLQTAFLLLWLGHAIAACILIGEISYEKRRKARRIGNELARANGTLALLVAREKRLARIRTGIS